MLADAQRQWRLLDLQGIDTRLAQIAHRTKNLPQTVEVTTATGEIAAVDSDLARARVARDDVQREVDKAESDVALVRDRADRNRSRLDAGTGPAKELQALQHELDSLGRRQGELEEVQLEVMERAERAEELVAVLTQKRAPLDDVLAAAESARDAALADLEEESAGLQRQRADVAAGVGEDLLALYEKIRAATGTGAAELRQRRCEGCHLELMAADLDRFRRAADDEVLRCEECRRILVRTGESGL